MRHTVFARSCVVVLAGVIGAATSAPPVYAEGFSLRLDTEQFGFEAATDHTVRFQWLHWWEANHRGWLGSGRLDTTTPRLHPDAESVGRAAEALRRTIEGSEEPALRAAAVVSLARLRPADADLATLLLGEPDPPPAEADRAEAPPPGLIHDPEARVREAAWVACGLVADPRCVEALLNAPAAKDELEAVAQAVGLGLLPNPTPQVTRRLVDRVRRGVTDEERRMAMWALQVHGVEADIDPLFDAVAAESANPPLTQQSMTDPTVNERLGRDAWLRDVGEGNRRGRAIAAWRAIEQDLSHGTFVIHGSSPDRLELELQTAATAAWGRQARTTSGHDEWLETLRGLSLKAMGMSHGPISERPSRAGDPLRAPTGSHMLRGAALITLARQTEGEEDDLEVLFEALDGETLVARTDRATGEYRRDRVTDRDALARGYAAIAFGVVGARLSPDRPIDLRRLDLPAHEAQQFRRRAARALVQLVEDRRACVGLRSAAAVGLGLMGDAGHAEALRRAAQTMRSGDAMVGGHLALALAMLDQPDARPLAERLLTTPRFDPDHDEVVLGRRAAARALQRLGRPAPIGAWAGTRGGAGWMNLELATLGHAVGDGRVSDTLVDRLLGDDAEAAWFAALALGRLHDADDTPRLDRLARHVNHTTTFRQISFRFVACGNTYVPVGGPPGWPVRDFHALSQPMLYYNLLARTASAPEALSAR